MKWLDEYQPYSSSKPIQFSVDNPVDGAINVTLQLTLSETIKVDNNQIKQSCQEPNLARNLLPKQSWDFTISCYKENKQLNHAPPPQENHTDDEITQILTPQKPVITLVDKD